MYEKNKSIKINKDWYLRVVKIKIKNLKINSKALIFIQGRVTRCVTSTI